MAKKNEFLEQNDPRLFMTSGGKQIELSMLPPLQAQMVQDAAQKEAVKLYGEAVRPTYETEAGEELPHDKDSLQTDEERAAWAKYQEILQQHQAHVSEKMLRFFLYYGVKADPDKDEGWQERQRFFGIEIPDDPIARKIHYIQSELIFSADDLQEITRRVMTLGGVRPEVVDAAAATFSDSARDSRA